LLQTKIVWIISRLVRAFSFNLSFKSSGALFKWAKSYLPPNKHNRSSLKCNICGSERRWKRFFEYLSLG